ncbi:MAG: hypothetical protein IJ751_07350 [Oscillospiraceae bacterium]|nr:hypothetical protein [Oscillospiraceae bacterium]
MRKKTLFCALLLCTLLVLSGCGRRGSQSTPMDVPAVSSGVIPTQGAASSEVEPEPEPEDDPFADAPYGVLGLSMEQVDLGDGLTRVATLGPENQTRDGYFYLQGVYGVGGGRVLLSYTVSNEINFYFEGDGEMYDGRGEDDWFDVDAEGVSDGDWDAPEADGIPEDDTQGQDVDGDAPPDDAEFPETEDFFAQTRLVLFDLDRGEEIRGIDAVDDVDTYSYFSQERDRIWLWNSQEGKRQVTQFDHDLNQVGEFSIGEQGYGAGGQDGSYYLVLDRRLYCYAPDGTPGVQVDFKRQFAPDEFIGSVFTGQDGGEYILLSGICGNLKRYEYVIVDLDSRDFAYLNSGDDFDSGLYGENGALVCSDYENGYTVAVQGTPWRYFCDVGEENYVTLRALENGWLLFFYTEDGSEGSVLHLEMMDGETGQSLGSARVDFADSWPWINNAVVYDDTNAVLLEVSENGTQFLRWDLDRAGTENGFVRSEAVDIPDEDELVPEITDGVDPNYYTPGECPPELADLRARADEMEARLGFEIYLADECRNMIGGYAIDALTDHDDVASALDWLEKEAEKYPEKFFRQLYAEWPSGLDIYLASTLTGMVSDQLSFAGGFQTIEGEHSLIVIDATFTSDIANTFHHELSHAVDSALERLSDFEADLDGEAWMALNPDEETYGESYTYDYNQFGREEMMPFAYLMSYDGSNAYFVDDYSMTYPTEDRARLFEYVMVDDDYCWVDWADCPHLRVKLNYFVSLIRQYFDTTGWDSPRWERFLEP